ncbi:Uncharacterised protein [Mycobacteroides abscessus subsp. massiliense]|nr:Uncharacterised protein [Mycobacteroides abscessus subsp. massiliense]
MYSFSFKTVTCFGQFEQLGIDGWHNQTDVVLLGQLENAVNVFGCIDTRHAESAVGNMAGRRHVWVEVSGKNADAV